MTQAVGPTPFGFPSTFWEKGQEFSRLPHRRGTELALLEGEPKQLLPSLLPRAGGQGQGTRGEGVSAPSRPGWTQHAASPALTSRSYFFCVYYYFLPCIGTQGGGFLPQETGSA